MNLKTIKKSELYNSTLHWNGKIQLVNYFSSINTEKIEQAQDPFHLNADPDLRFAQEKNGSG